MPFPLSWEANRGFPAENYTQEVTMPSERCFLCFKARDTVRIRPGMSAQVCKACFYEIDRVIGFLEHYGCQMVGPLGASVKTPLAPLDRGKGRGRDNITHGKGRRPKKTEKAAEEVQRGLDNGTIR